MHNGDPGVVSGVQFARTLQDPCLWQLRLDEPCKPLRFEICLLE